MKTIFKTAAAGLLTSFFTAPTALAQDWEYTAGLNLWMAGINGTTQFGSDFEVGFDDLLDNLDFGVLASLEARRGKWFVLGDLVYLDVSAGASSTRALLPGLPGGAFSIDSTAKVAVKGTVLNIVGGYELVRDQNFVLHGVAGARYLELKTELDLEVSAGGGANSVVVRESGDKLDGIVGLRGRAELDNNWFVPFYADIGAGQSDLTWQAFAGVGYEFERSDLVVGYRHMGWDLGDNSLISDISFGGIVIKYGFTF